MILLVHLCTLRIPARDTLIYFELYFVTEIITRVNVNTHIYARIEGVWLV